jgi:general secretion pathway protein F/type IV pilus assembly protein PilC
MPTFEYMAQTLGGASDTGVITAQSRVEAIHQLRDLRLTPVSLQEVKETKRVWGKRIPKGALANCYVALADLLESGMPLLKTLDVVAAQLSRSDLRAAVGQLKDDVANGSSLASAMSRQPQVFDGLTTSMIAVGEEGGFLESALQRVAKLSERQEELKGRLLGALAYPAFLLCAGLIVCSGMLIYFVPLFEPLFERMRERGELPLPTIMLLSLSAFVRSAWHLAAILSLVAAIVIRNWMRSEAGQWVWDRTRLKLYGLGPVLRDLTLSRFFHVLGTLLSNGVPVIRSLEMAEKSAGNLAIAKAVNQASQVIAAGGSLSTPLKESGLFPLDVTEMIAVGEQSNRLEQVLLGLAEKLDRRAQKKLEVLTKLLEPALMTLLAALIGFLIVALLLPVFTSSGRFA